MYEMKSSLQLIFICLLLTVPVGDAFGDVFPGEGPSRGMIKIQEKAQKLFEEEKYERALLIYKNDLAPFGDKYAQYMVGYIYLAGKGVPQDAITASAWYRLSAERDNSQFRRVSDKLLALMNDEQRSRSDMMFVELRRDFGDIELLSRLIRADLRVLADRFGSTAIRQNEFERGNFKTPSGRFEDAAERIEMRVDFATSMIDADETIIGDEREELIDFLRSARLQVDNFYAVN